MEQAIYSSYYFPKLSILVFFPWPSWGFRGGRQVDQDVISVCLIPTGRGAAFRMEVGRIQHHVSNFPSSSNINLKWVGGHERFLGGRKITALI